MRHMQQKEIITTYLKKFEYDSLLKTNLETKEEGSW